ncbi:MAG: 4-(cytidine 5'-diphospho)-2-C-methyl-D-erythritol kinase [Nitrospinae bacterium RIFCSPLOWO2_12_FULL_47_7]|nr:MAG: 4-(cytidine 5'-diphospho)-2-C-methyl-D-erythritol kinase [Nitrospinae bacterium RIFCSPLOWO2_12_FULL_47_7]
MKLAFRTPAKINLGLQIVRKREDGYHELETLFQMVSLYDDISLENLPSGIELECDHPDIPRDESNLVVRAARLLMEMFPRRRDLGVRIRLIKRIPAGGGLGGGSGNAAGVLLGLNVLWDLRLRKNDLLLLAGKLGSDVPFFLFAPSALGKGRGEILSPIQQAKKFNIILISPKFPIVTSWVYRNLKLGLTKRENHINLLQKFYSHSDIKCLGAHLYNDLEPVVLHEYPEIQTLKDALRLSGAEGSLLSGSGSTVFGIYANTEVAKAAYSSLLKKESWDLFLTETIDSLAELFPEEMLKYPSN